MRIYYLFIFLFVFINTFAQGLYIIEISIFNVSKEYDKDYNHSGWIELYNSTNKDISTADLIFSDDKNDYKKYKLEGDTRIIPSKGYCIIWLNGEIQNKMKGLIFDGDSDGAFLSVGSYHRDVYDEITYPVQYTNITYGRKTDGGDEWG